MSEGTAGGMEDLKYGTITVFREYLYLPDQIEYTIYFRLFAGGEKKRLDFRVDMADVDRYSVRPPQEFEAYIRGRFHQMVLDKKYRPAIVQTYDAKD